MGLISRLFTISNLFLIFCFWRFLTYILSNDKVVKSKLNSLNFAAGIFLKKEQTPPT